MAVVTYVIRFNCGWLGLKRVLFWWWYHCYSDSFLSDQNNVSLYSFSVGPLPYLADYKMLYVDIYVIGFASSVRKPLMYLIALW